MGPGCEGGLETGEEAEMSEIPTLAEYYDMLAAHDWFHAMSDDHMAWQGGRRREVELRQIANAGGPAYEDLLADWEDFVSGYMKGNRPRRPAERKNRQTG